MDVQHFVRSLVLLFFMLEVFFSVSLSRNVHHFHNRHHHLLSDGRRGSSSSSSGRARRHTSLPNATLGDGAPKGGETGPWGDWSDSSECSRTCGGGVAFQTRSCLGQRPDGSPTCVGPVKKYFSCNIQDCSDGTSDFRADQCLLYDKVAFEGRFFKWIPYLNAPNKCELNCVPKGERFYYRHAKKVIDGTRCDQDSLDICVDGVCLAVGCDMMLGSSTKEDKCRECGGDGSTCKTVEGLFDLDNLQIGYNDILLIPTGATNIYIQERKATNNYLAVRNQTGHYYLNGNWRIDFPRDLHIAGTTFHYERKPHGFLAPESLRALGPTTQPIFVVLLYQETNPGILYEYSIPLGTSTAQPDAYSWIYGDFSECSRTCGAGFQTRTVNCAQTNNFKVVADFLCDPLLQPPNNRTCNAQSCPPSWDIGEWEECSASCGGGTQYRMVYCQQVQQGEVPSIVNNNVCLKSSGPRPQHLRKCNEQIRCPEWHAGPWALCNKMCGDGEQTRLVTCQRTVDGRIQVFPDYSCDNSKRPQSKQKCKSGPCEGVDWIVSDWSGCDTCGLLRESRLVHCSNQTGNLFPDELCAHDRQPDFLRDCPDSPPCDVMWHATEWSECSAKCGTGIQTRIVFCAATQGAVIEKVPNEKCNPLKKYDVVRNCTSKPCKGVWFGGPWNRCNAPCGGGHRNRKVLCLLEEEQVVDTSHCDPSERPDHKETCNQHPCDEDEILMVGGCKSSKHGCCPDGVTAAGPNFKGCPKVAPPPGGCARSEFGCCKDNLTAALGPFEEGCPRITRCEETKHKCCPDGITPARGPDNDGCPDPITCAVTLYGCCPDGETPASGRNFKGCVFTPGEDCTELKHGCCPDGITAAEGPDNMGCEDIEASGEDCHDSAYGCCDDGLTPANGPNKKGCDNIGIPVDPVTDSPDAQNCDDTPYGCCPDGLTAASGPAFAGCDASKTTTPSDCFNTLYGCCPDGVIAARGINYEGCASTESDCHLSPFGCCPDGLASAGGPNYENCATPPPLHCSDQRYGCCPDKRSSAQGPNFHGCPCDSMHYGCCPDGETTATGPNYEGCGCVTTLYGCCPDGTSDAQGFDYEGCGCHGSTYGCCPDGVAEATGPNYEGCCDASPYGCCPDRQTLARGPHYEGCHTGCEVSQYGCCPDRITAARGPNQEGCQCANYPYGCCADGRTVARGPNQEGCSCEYTAYGCCQDGVTAALGTSYEGCPVVRPTHETRPTEGTRPTERTRPTEGTRPTDGPSPPIATRPTDVTKPGAEVCGLPKERGPCRNFTVKWFFDMGYGGCSRFWYGGCEGNDNQFGSQEECEEVCVTPEGMDACHLPKVSGPCDSHAIFWYFDVPSGQCGEFYYGGCLGNNNRFNSKEECERTCAKAEVQDPCLQPKVEGPCPGEFLRWYYDRDATSCKQFRYGGCKGNHNNFENERSCIQQCASRNEKDSCVLPKEAGSCSGNFNRWYYDVAAESCRHFHYGGCQGNTNRFISLDLCEHTCNQTKVGDICTLPRAEGPCHESHVRWYFEPSEGRCRQFYFGGCEGNANRFETEVECQRVCSSSVQVTDTCSLSSDTGPCKASVERWFFDKGSSRCQNFIYGGCGGNDNNFATQADCENRCGDTVSATEDFRTEDCHLASSYGRCDDNLIRWHYDKSDGVCKQFYYSGCNGNKNRFMTRQECEHRCFNSQDICELPKVVGPCSGKFHQWYYNSEKRACEEFFFGGCEGNANRFDSQGECETQCRVAGTAPTQDNGDPCTLPRDPGPCESSVGSWYFDTHATKCQPFVYGGCEGNTNRFISEESCERACGQYKAHLDVCGLPQDPGPCLASFKKWYHDPTSHACKSFVYGGCDGNGNRFSTKKECEQVCIARKFFADNDTYATPSASCPDPEDCHTLGCRHGVEEFKDDQGCLKCRCFNPCDGIHCPEETTCVVEVHPNAHGDSRGHPVCRRNVKPGDCPYVSHDTRGSCTHECETDVDCSGDHKCCFNGCGTWCTDPFEFDFEPVTSQPHLHPSPLETPDEPPQIEPSDAEVRIRSTHSTSLQCVARGSPTPDISWRKDGQQLSVDGHRLLLLGNGTLEIRNSSTEDNGVYTCVANNGVGTPAEMSVRLSVEVPVSAKIILPITNFAVDSNIWIDCQTEGGDQVMWYKDGILLQPDPRTQIMDNGTLVIYSATPSDTATYRCEASNAYNVASTSVSVTVDGFQLHPNCTDNPYFANCKLIVKAKYCVNKYYARFCCKSCTLAGQLAVFGPHLPGFSSK